MSRNIALVPTSPSLLSPNALFFSCFSPSSFLITLVSSYSSFFPSHSSPLLHPLPPSLPQVPALFRLPIFDECSTGVGYALLLTVPVFYVCSSLLFSLLGCVIFYWEKRQTKKLSSYNVFTNEDAQTSVIPQ